jgi:CHASE3 domain sensor protein
VIGSGVAAVAVGLVLLTLALALAGQRESNRRVRSAELVLRTASDAERAVIDIETGLRGYVITGERRFLEPYRTGAAVAPARAARLAKLTARRITQAPRARLLQQKIDDYFGVYARPLVALAARAPARARSAALTDEGKRRVDAIRTGFAALGALEADRLRRATNGADSDAQRAIAVGVGGLLALLAVVVALGWYVARRLAHPLRDMAGAAGRLAVGDLSVRVPEGGVGELDRLAHAFNAMAASLDEAQAALRRRAAELETAGERTEALFDTVFARAPVGLAVLDPRMRFVRVNQTLAAMDGVPEDEHLGHGIGEVLPDMAGEIGARLRDVVADKRTIADAEVEGATRAAPAEQRIWRASYFPIVTEGGETLGTGAIFVDITEHRLAARERRRLLQGERRAAQRTARLQQVTARLSRAVGSHDVAQVVVEQGIAALGAGAGVVVVAAPRSSELELAAIAGYDDAEALDWRKLSVAGRTPLADAVRTGQAVSLPDRATLRERYPGRREVLERSGHRAWIAAPIAAAGDVRGGALFAFGAEGRLGDDEARLLELLLAQAGAALDRAALFERQRHIASTLQRSLLPARLPEIPGVELAAVYRPAGDGNEVGGDFYDVVPTARGSWVVAIGDVQGKGPEAAALTGLVRHTLRAETMHRSDPSELLARLNRVVYVDDTDRFCTVALAAIEPRPDGVGVSIACGGHLPPIVTRRTDAPVEIACRGTLLGIEENVRIAAQRLELGVGDGLVLLHRRGPRRARPLGDAHGDASRRAARRGRRRIAAAGGRRAARRRGRCYAGAARRHRDHRLAGERPAARRGARRRRVAGDRCRRADLIPRARRSSRAGRTGATAGGVSRSISTRARGCSRPATCRSSSVSGAHPMRARRTGPWRSVCRTSSCACRVRTAHPGRCCARRRTRRRRVRSPRADVSRRSGRTSSACGARPPPPRAG